MLAVGDIHPVRQEEVVAQQHVDAAEVSESQAGVVDFLVGDLQDREGGDPGLDRFAPDSRGVPVRLHARIAGLFTGCGSGTQADDGRRGPGIELYADLRAVEIYLARCVGLQRGCLLDVHDIVGVPCLGPIDQVYVLAVLGLEQVQGALRQVVLDVGNAQEVLSEQADRTFARFTAAHNEINVVERDVEDGEGLHRGH